MTVTSGQGEDNRNRPADRSKSAELRDSAVSGSVVQAGEIQGGVHFHVAERQTVRPRELPPPPADFAGREPELAELDRFAEEAAGSDVPLITVVAGVGGVGKTALLLHWLHRRQAEFPDGQLYIDLHGFSPAEATPPSEALGRFLRSLGVSPEQIPGEFEERAALFRTLTAGRRVCVLADNALSAAQVRALLPGPGTGLVAVTSRRAIHGLLSEGARFVDLRPLDEQGAAELLENLIGRDRAGTDPAAARELTALCGRLPIAIRAVAARLVRRRFLDLDRVVRDLSDERRRIAALSPADDIDDVTVRSAFDLSYAALDTPVATLYRRLGLLPGPTFTPAVVPVLMDLGEEACEPLLEELLSVSLIEEVTGSRFRLHDLVRLHAAEKAEDADPAGDRTERLRRVVAWYLARAALADRAVLPGRERIGPAAEAARREPAAFTSARDALDWLEDELPNLLAALRAANRTGFHELAWQFGEALWGLFISRRTYPEWIAADEIGVASARACGDERARARLLTQLGVALVDLRRLDEAERRFSESLDCARAAGDLLGEASAIHRIGQVRLVGDRPDEAIPYFIESRDRHAEAGAERGAAMLTRRLGEAYRAGGRYPEAIAHIQEAVERFTELDDRYNISLCALGLAQTYILAGEPGCALAPLDQAQEMARAAGSVFQEARAHLARADAREALGDPPAARRELQEALPLLVRVESPEVDEVRARLRRIAADDET